MTGTKSASKTNQSSSAKALKLNRRKAIRVAGISMVLIFAAWIIVAVVQRHNAIDHQQQLFDKIQQLQQNFKSSVTQSLGSSLTGMIQHNSCYNTGQSDVDNGYLACSMNVEGTSNVLQGLASTGHEGWNTALVIAAAAKMSLNQSGVDILQYSFGDRHGKDPNNNIGYDDQYSIKGTRANCQLSVETQHTPVHAHGLDIKSGALYFSFNCEQPVSKNFFQFRNT